MSPFEAPLDLTRLTPLMKRTAGRREVVIGLVDGPVDLESPGLAASAFREMALHIHGKTGGCDFPQSNSCRHGTFIAGILAANRGARAPSICPGCTILLRPIFSEEETMDLTPATSPGNLAEAITEVIDLGANIVNLSCQLLRASPGAERDLQAAFDYAASRGVICVAAAGNEGMLGSSAITRHKWVIPVAACDCSGRPAEGSNLGHSIGSRGMLAPGDGIQSLGSESNEFAFRGTSVAAPFVAGAAALLCSEFPEAKAEEVWQSLNLSQVLRRSSIVPPLLDAWRSYQWLLSRFGRRQES